MIVQRARVASLFLLGAIQLSAATQQTVQSVRGMVRGAGSPLGGAQVFIGPRQAVTNRDGAFLIDSLGPGEYSLTIRMVGYVPLRSHITIGTTAPAERVYDLATAPVQLPAVVVEGRRTGIYGTIADTSLAPLRGARISVVGDRGGEARTDSVGQFAFPRADRGTYILRVVLEGYAERRLSLDLKRGEGREVAITLAPASGPLSRLEDVALQELGTRLAFGLERERITATQLKRYSSLPLCDLPRVAGELGHFKDVPVALSINAVTIDTRAKLSQVCSWRADEVELVEFGVDICQDVTGTIPNLAGIWCSGKTRTLPRSIMNGGPRIATQPGGMRYIIIWEKR